MTILAICGFQSSGKDTLADYLATYKKFKKLSFASVLKDIIATLFDWPRDKLEGITKEDRMWREERDEWWATELNMPDLTPRYVLQYFGTELFRNHWHQDIWLKVVEKQLSKYDNVVIADCRFPNEMEMLKKHGAKIIHIYRNTPEWVAKYQQGDDSVNEAQLLHPSERGWIRGQPDFIIHNDGTIEELYSKVSGELEAFFGDNLGIGEKLEPTTTANNCYNYSTKYYGISLDDWVQNAHKHNCEVNKWNYTPLKKGSFGYDNLACSIGYLLSIDGLIKQNQFFDFYAHCIHEGWCINYKYWRDYSPFLSKTHNYIAPYSPLNDSRRNECATTAYVNLSEEEREKDNVIARYIMSVLFAKGN